MPITMRKKLRELMAILKAKGNFSKKLLASASKTAPLPRSATVLAMNSTFPLGTGFICLKYIIPFVFSLSILAGAAQAVPDPLDPSYMPAIDTNPADYPSNIWVTDTMQKVRQDNSSPGTQHWGTFYGTQNEFVDFQVHVQAPAGGYSALTVTASSFVQTAPTSFTIPAPSASSTNVLVYREGYMNVTIKTAVSATYFNSTGVYPDILIPSIDPYWGQTTNAWPFNVAAAKNQSAWVDVLIPPSAPSGYYLGTVTVKNGSSTLATMPVILAVWQWPASQGGKMPATPTLRTEMSEFQYNALCTQAFSPGSGSATTLCGNYPDSGGNNDGGITQMNADGAMVFKDHRWHVGGRENVYPESGSFSTYVTQIGPLMNGTCRHGGAYCPVLSGSKNTTKQIEYGSLSAAVFGNWATNFATNGWTPTTTLFDYLKDEPGASCSAWTGVISDANTRHGFHSPAYMPELVTATYAQASPCGGLNSADILVANIKLLEPPGGPLENLTNYTNWLAAPNPAGVKRQFWSYQACDSTGTCGNGTVGNSLWTLPNVNIDGKPAANRAMEWMTFLHGQTGELYYDPAYCLEPTQVQNCGSPQSNDTWKNNYVFGGWGEGAFVYVGQGTISGASNYVGAGVTKPIIIPGILLKHMRDGVQDYEYLNALKVAGQGAFANSQVASWITNSYTFETSGTGLMSARQALGTKLHQLTSWSGSAPSPCDVNGDLQTNVVDAQLEVNMALGITPCTNPSGVCTVVSVQRVVNAALGGTCVTP
jgi:hypothetical protein